MAAELARVPKSEWSEEEEHAALALESESELAPAWRKRKLLLKQLSMTMCETPRDMAWERRRRQDRRRRNYSIQEYCDYVTDEDLRELRGCIELGFGFNEEDGQTLCNTLPALDLYFAVNRHLSPSPVSTPTPHHSRASSSLGSPTGADSDSWKICSPGDDPAHIKTKLRHWAQAVACSVMQSH